MHCTTVKMKEYMFVSIPYTELYPSRTKNEEKGKTHLRPSVKMWFSLHRFSWNSLSVDGIAQRFPVPYCKELGQEMWRKLRAESHFTRISKVWPAVTAPIFTKLTNVWLLVKKKKKETSYAEFHENPTNSSVADTGLHNMTDGRTDVVYKCSDFYAGLQTAQPSRCVPHLRTVAVWYDDHAGDLMTNMMMIIHL